VGRAGRGRFRGPNGSGVTADTAPVKWSPSENLNWKVTLPGPGVSSPIVVGDRVFVTCYSGYGVDRRDPGSMEELQRHLLCIDLQTGTTIWDKAVEAVLPEDPFSGIGVPAHGYASHTPVSDGQRVYVHFGKSGALAFDMDGNQIWQRSVGKESDPWSWGSAASPVLYKNLLIVSATAESQALVALNTETGAEVWRQEASGFDGTWSTPVLASTGDNRTDLVLSVPNELWAFDAETGKLRWYCESSPSEQVNASAVIHDGVVYVLGNRGGGSIAVRVDGDGDVSKSHVLWTGRDSSRFGTPLVHEGKMYVVANGVVSCVNAKTGESIAQARLEGASAANRPSPPNPNRRPGGGGFGGGQGGFGAQDYSSPVIAGDKLYYVTGTGVTHVFQIGDALEQIAVNRLTDESETFGGTPAISGGKLLIRSNTTLYCVAEQADQ
jgi:outer membrane protein assembly factor BamB